MKKVGSFLGDWLPVILGVCSMALLFWALLQLCMEHYAPTLYGEYEVIRVVDGDTIDVEIDGEGTRVRLIGVDTPESVHPDENRNTEEGKAAADWLRELLDGEKVYLEYDTAQTDKYDRALAYVYLSDRKTMVNKLLLENGIAQVMTVPPNSKYSDEFYTLQTRARKAGTGFWAEAWS